MRIIVFSITLIMGGGGGHNNLSRYGESLVQWITCGTSANIILTTNSIIFSFYALTMHYFTGSDRKGALYH